MRLRWLSGLVVLALVGCQNQPEQYSSTYLMQHPSLLKTEMVRCQTTEGDQPDAYCTMVTQTTNDFFSILLQQQREPEAFGQRIMQAQVTYGDALTEAEAAKQHLHSLISAHASAAEIAAGQTAYQEALVSVKDAKTNVDTLLVIVGETSPE